MTLSDRLRALRVLGTERLRTLLTLVGIIVGSASIVLVAGLVAGARGALVAAAQSATGSDLISVHRRELGAEERLRGKPELSRSDADALERSWIGSGRQIHAEAWQEAQATRAGKHKRVRLVSGNAEVRELFRLQVARGRFLDASDLASRRRVCVVGHEVWTDLLDRRAPDGTLTLQADGTLWTVVGVLERKPLIGSTDGTHIWDRKIVVPETSFDVIYGTAQRADRILLKGAGASAPLDTVRRGLKALLLRRHHGAENFELDDASAREQERVILAIIQILLVCIGALALFVGGINVANVMLVTVSERTREIGLRRALGATRGSILIQFLLESSVLALSGGALGVVCGASLVSLGGAALGHAFGEFPARLEAWSVVVAIGLSLATGLGAGALPALRAARLSPVLALRSE